MTYSPQLQARFKLATQELDGAEGDLDDLGNSDQSPDPTESNNAGPTTATRKTSASISGDYMSGYSVEGSDVEAALNAIADNWGGVGCSRNRTAEGMEFTDSVGARYIAIGSGSTMPTYEDSGQPNDGVTVGQGEIMVRCIDDAPDSFWSVKLARKTIQKVESKTAGKCPGSGYMSMTSVGDELEGPTGMAAVSCPKCDQNFHARLIKSLRGAPVSNRVRVPVHSANPAASAAPASGTIKYLGSHDEAECDNCGGGVYREGGGDGKWAHDNGQKKCPKTQDANNKESAMTTNREAQILEAMRYASLSEQVALVEELGEIRSTASRKVQADRDWDASSAEIVADHLTPVLVHGMHSTATDWLDDAAPEYHEANLKDISDDMRAEASVWMTRVSPAVRADRQELIAQASGVASRISGQYGEMATVARDQFMNHIAHLTRLADGTDMAGVPSAADPVSDAHPEADDWSATPPANPPADIGSYTAPPGLDALPESATQDPTTDGDSAPTPAPPLPEDETFDNGTNAARPDNSQVATSQTTAKGKGWRKGDPKKGEDPDSYYDYDEGKTAAYGCPKCRTTDAAKFRGTHCRACGWQKGGGRWSPDKPQPSMASLQRRAYQIFAVEEGQAFPVPGEQDVEQSGEAGSSLPLEVTVTGHPDTFNTFVPPTPAKPAPSTRAPNVKATRRQAGWDETFDKLEKGKTCDSCGGKDGNHHGGCSKLPGNTATRRTAIETGPNPQGSTVYDGAVAESQGYEEGFHYALLWTPGKPIPAHLTSAAVVGHKYNAEYVTGFRKGAAEGVATLDAEVQAAWAAETTTAQVLSRRKTAEDHSFTCPQCGVNMNWNEEGTGDPEPVDGLCPDCADPYSDSNRSKEASLPQLELSAMDQTVSNPLTWRAGTPPAVDGDGAADVASVPTPGQSVADYPQPQGPSPEPSVANGEEPVEDWLSKAEATLRRGR